MAEKHEPVTQTLSLQIHVEGYPRGANYRYILMTQYTKLSEDAILELAGRYELQLIS